MRLFSESILHKSGFDDGEILSELLTGNGFDIDDDASNQYKLV